MQNKYYLKDIMTTLINKILNPWRQTLSSKMLKLEFSWVYLVFKYLVFSMAKANKLFSQYYLAAETQVLNILLTL
jgi:hypothetical protein